MVYSLQLALLIWRIAMGAMSSKFRKVKPASVEQRLALDEGSFAYRVTIRRPEARSRSARLAELSRYGCRLAIGSTFQIGECLSLQFGKEAVVAAYVVWQEDGKLACRFSESLQASLLRQLTLTAN